MILRCSFLCICVYVYEGFFCLILDFGFGFLAICLWHFDFWRPVCGIWFSRIWYLIRIRACSKMGLLGSGMSV